LSPALSLSQELVSSYIGLGLGVDFVQKKSSKFDHSSVTKNKITKDDSLALALVVIYTSLANR